MPVTTGLVRKDLGARMNGSRSERRQYLINTGLSTTAKIYSRSAPGLNPSLRKKSSKRGEGCFPTGSEQICDDRAIAE